MSEFPLGVDISAYQFSSDGKRKPNFDIINAKCEFVAVRAGISWGYTDRWFSDRKSTRLNSSHRL